VDLERGAIRVDLDIPRFHEDFTWNHERSVRRWADAR
jgi:hypothetical protein